MKRLWRVSGRSHSYNSQLQAINHVLMNRHAIQLLHTHALISNVCTHLKLSWWDSYLFELSYHNRWFLVVHTTEHNSMSIVWWAVSSKKICTNWWWQWGGGEKKEDESMKNCTEIFPKKREREARQKKNYHGYARVLRVKVRIFQKLPTALIREENPLHPTLYVCLNGTT